MTQSIGIEILRFSYNQMGPKRWMHLWLSIMSFIFYLLLGGHMDKGKWQSKSTFGNLLTAIS